MTRPHEERPAPSGGVVDRMVTSHRSVAARATTTPGPRPPIEHSGTDLPVYAYIQLTQGAQAIVDRSLFDYLSQWIWTYERKTGYARRTETRMDGSRRTVYLHRVVAKAKPGDYIDHVNGNKLDDRLSNLRKATTAQNAMNTRTRANSTSGVTGVSFDKKRQLWRAYIVVDGKQTFLGYHVDRAEAERVRKDAETRLHGEFAPQDSL